MQGFGASQIVSFVSNPFLEPIIQLLELTSHLFALEFDLNDKNAGFNRLVAISSQLAKDVQFESIAFTSDAQKLSISEFLEHGTHCLLSMALCELVIKFMEARVAFLLPKLRENLSLEKIEKSATQHQELFEHFQSLKLTEADESDSRKAKKVTTKAKAFDELNDEVNFFKNITPMPVPQK